MNGQASFSLRGRNPDVLTCIANLSNDEVFTPPEFANRMLDTLAEAWAANHGGADIWADSSVRFLDPFTKSGVFPREITSRLIKGLASELPDLQARVDHILTKQVFGIGITHLTSLLARRSVYCSKHASGEHSVARGFINDAGNIWFERVEHTWVDGKCKFCGASQKTLDRGEELETHAYAFIHADDIKARIAEMFGDNMQFDVIIGNPPYQLDDGGFGTSAAPIYQLFVQQAKALDPRYLAMVIPSRWFAGGKGLDEFRESMLTDNRVRSIDDYLSAADVFPGVGLKGGVCYFLWDRDNPGLCRVSTHFKDWPISTSTRPLLEKGADVFIRFNEGLSILKKVAAVENPKRQSISLLLPEEKRFERLVSSRKPFGLQTTFKGKRTRRDGDLLVYQNGGRGYIRRESISTGVELIDQWKLFAGYAAPGTGNKDSFWFMPKVAACHAMANLLAEKHNVFWHEYKIVVAAGARAGIGLAALPPVRKAIGSGFDTKTITLSCGKLTTGVTVPQWSSILMLRNLKSPETYFQAAFRVQSPWSIENPNGDNPNEEEILKPVCFVFDFAPTRALHQLSSYGIGLSPNEPNPENAVKDLVSFLPVLAYDGSYMEQLDAGRILDYAMSGTTGTLLARKWESAQLVNVDNETLRRVLDNPEAMAAVERIEGWRALGNHVIETIINKSEKVKGLKKKAKEKDLTKKQQKQLSEAEKEYKSQRKLVQEKLIKFATRIPAFMYLTDFRENTLQDVITKLEPDLFLAVTGLTVKDFHLLVRLKVFNTEQMNQAVFAFRRYEDASLQYTGIESHDGLTHYGLYDTVVEKS